MLAAHASRNPATIASHPQLQRKQGAENQERGMSDRRFDQGGRVAAACQAFLTHFFRYPLSVEIPETGAGQFAATARGIARAVLSLFRLAS